MAQVILSALEYPDTDSLDPESFSQELSILILDDLEIEVLNKKYLNKTGPTNVLSFPMHEGSFSNITPQLLGDVVISADTAEKESRSMGISLEERFGELLVHGILHLMGYDHEKTEKEAAEMELKSRELMKILAKTIEE